MKRTIKITLDILYIVSICFIIWSTMALIVLVDEHPCTITRYKEHVSQGADAMTWGSYGGNNNLVVWDENTFYITVNINVEHAGSSGGTEIFKGMTTNLTTIREYYKVGAVLSCRVCRVAFFPMHRVSTTHYGEKPNWYRITKPINAFAAQWVTLGISTCAFVGVLLAWTARNRRRRRGDYDLLPMNEQAVKYQSPLVE